MSLGLPINCSASGITGVLAIGHAAAYGYGYGYGYGCWRRSATISRSSLRWSALPRQGEAGRSLCRGWAYCRRYPVF